MSEGKFGEPLSIDEDTIAVGGALVTLAADGRVLDMVAPEGGWAPMDICESDARRRVACVNAFAGIEDPAAFMKLVRESLNAFDVLGDWDRKYRANFALRAMLPKEG